MRKLVSVLACRNNGSRLYGKPLQNIDIENNKTILDVLIESLKSQNIISSVVLAISEKTDNYVYKSCAEKHGIPYVLGDDRDVLLRLINGCKAVNGTDIFRVTSESPFPHLELLNNAWKSHLEDGNDLTTLDNVPDGTGFEIISLKALENSWTNGESRHRSELCTLFIRENKDIFQVAKLGVDPKLQRQDLRVTVDYPEDLILCRFLYSELTKKNLGTSLNNIINILDNNTEIKNLVERFVDDGNKLMNK